MAQDRKKLQNAFNKANKRRNKVGLETLRAIEVLYTLERAANIALKRSRDNRDDANLKRILGQKDRAVKKQTIKLSKLEKKIKAANEKLDKARRELDNFKG